MDFPKTRRKFIYRTIKRYRDIGKPQTGQEVEAPSLQPTYGTERLCGVGFGESATFDAKIPSEIKIFRESVHTIVKRDLGLFPYKRGKVHFISAAIKQKRLTRSKILRDRFASHGLDQIIFSDEKLFTVEQALNTHNDRILSSYSSTIPDEYRLVKRVQKPQSVMVWAGISTKGRTPLVFIPPGVKINAVKYQELVLF